MPDAPEPLFPADPDWPLEDWEPGTSYSQLMLRPGWSKAAEVFFLGGPDGVRTNNKHRVKRYSMSVYRDSRIEEVEASEEWAAWRAGVYRHAQTAERTVSGANRGDRIRSSTVIVRHSDLPLPLLLEVALASYNERKTETRRHRGLSPHIPVTRATIPPADATRLLVNYLGTT